MSGDTPVSPQDNAENLVEIPDKSIDASFEVGSTKPIHTESLHDEMIASSNETGIPGKASLTFEELQSNYSALSQENESLRGQCMRIAADFDNFRKRQARDQEDLRLQLTCSTLESILPVVDNFERARQQLDPQTDEGQELHRSYQGLYKQLVDTFKQIGVSPMRVEGESFDPNLHEAVLREPSEVYSEDIITEELQRGYQLNGKVLRHALVKVSMGPGPKSDDNTISPNPSSNDKDESIS